MKALVKNHKLEQLDRVPLKEDRKDQMTQIRNLCKAYEKLSANTGKIFFVDLVK
jgi:hypothetical protein